jgi:very-short-patch-repair endonuclease
VYELILPGEFYQMQLNNLHYLKSNRKRLRNNLTPAEAGLWKLLQGKKLGARKFRRQHSVGNYILDFYCPSEKIAIELDGAGHYTEEGMRKDELRTKFLNEVGIKVIRFENKLVFEKTEWVLEEISRSFAPPRPADTPPLEEGS